MEFHPTIWLDDPELDLQKLSNKSFAPLHRQTLLIQKQNLNQLKMNKIILSCSKPSTRTYSPSSTTSIPKSFYSTISCTSFSRNISRDQSNNNNNNNPQNLFPLFYKATSTSLLVATRPSIAYSFITREYAQAKAKGSASAVKSDKEKKTRKKGISPKQKQQIQSQTKRLTKEERRQKKWERKMTIPVEIREERKRMLADPKPDDVLLTRETWLVGLQLQDQSIPRIDVHELKQLLDAKVIWWSWFLICLLLVLLSRFVRSICEIFSPLG